VIVSKVAMHRAYPHLWDDAMLRMPCDCAYGMWRAALGQSLYMQWFSVLTSRCGGRMWAKIERARSRFACSRPVVPARRLLSLYRMQSRCNMACLAWRGCISVGLLPVNSCYLLTGQGMGTVFMVHSGDRAHLISRQRFLKACITWCRCQTRLFPNHTLHRMQSAAGAASIASSVGIYIWQQGVPHKLRLPHPSSDIDRWCLWTGASSYALAVHKSPNWIWATQIRGVLQANAGACPVIDGRPCCDWFRALGCIQAVLASVNIILSGAQQFMGKLLSDSGRRGEKCATAL